MKKKKKKKNKRGNPGAQAALIRLYKEWDKEYNYMRRVAKRMVVSKLR